MDSLEQIQAEHGVEPINQAFAIFGRSLMNTGFFSGVYVPKEVVLKALNQRIDDETHRRGRGSPVVLALRILLRTVDKMSWPLEPPSSPP